MSRRATGGKDDPLLIDSSEEDNAVRAGPSHKNGFPRSHFPGSMPVDLTISNPGEDTQPLPHAPTLRRKSSSPTRRRRHRVSLANIPNYVELSDEDLPGPSMPARSRKSKETSSAALGTWLNPTSIMPGVPVSIPAASAQRGTQDPCPPRTHPASSSALESSSTDSDMASEQLAHRQPSQPKQRVKVDSSAGSGTWINPQAIVPRNPSHNRGSSPDFVTSTSGFGSWANPVEIKPRLSVNTPKRLASPVSPDVEGSTVFDSDRRRGRKAPRILSPPTIGDPSDSIEQPKEASPVVLPPKNVTPQRIGPRWATCNDEVPTLKTGETSQPVMEIAAVPSTPGESPLVPLTGIFGDDSIGPQIPHVTTEEPSVPSPPLILPAAVGTEDIVMIDRPAGESSEAIVHNDDIAVPDLPLDEFSTPMSAPADGPVVQEQSMDLEEDVKPGLSDLQILIPSGDSRGLSATLPIEIELDDDDLAEITSNDGEGEGIDGPHVEEASLDVSKETNKDLEEAVEDVRIGVDEVEIEPPEAVSPQPSSAPSIEEIQQEAMPIAAAGSSKHPKRIPERTVQDAKMATAQALSIIRTRRQTKNKQNSDRPLSVSSGERSPSPNLQVVIPTRSKREWRRVVETEGETDVEDMLDDDGDSPPSSRPSNGFDIIDSSELTIRSVFHLPPLIPDSPPPLDRHGQANRILDTRLIDDWNRRKPHLTNNPSLHRAVFEAYMAQCTSVDEPLADEIRVVNTVDGEGAPPDFEFQYSNDMLYNPEVPDPELSLGCDCDGPCDPNSTTCSCVRRQELYFYDLGMKGFAYDENGRIKETSVSVWECGKNCGCPPECMNRVIQRGRGKDTKIELFKTRWKGWGVRAAAPIQAGAFLGIYAGEIITEQESEERGNHYAKLGRTYLFDCDGWQIANPPSGLENIDRRAAELAEAAAQRAKQVALEADDPAWVYSAYSVDAFHYGNFTRYFNHSCEPNLAITQAYVKDFHPERPILVIFARRPVRSGEELCISYKGLPDDDAEIRPATPSPKVNRKGKKNSKTSASAHITGTSKSKVAAKDRCMCGTPRCDGRMFNYGD